MPATPVTAVTVSLARMVTGPVRTGWLAVPAVTAVTVATPVSVVAVVLRAATPVRLGLMGVMARRAPVATPVRVVLAVTAPMVSTPRPRTAARVVAAEIAGKRASAGPGRPRALMALTGHPPMPVLAAWVAMATPQPVAPTPVRAVPAVTAVTRSPVAMVVRAVPVVSVVTR